MRNDPFDADDPPSEEPPRGAPHLRQRGMRTEPCRYGDCDGSGWIEVEETNGARECGCRRERVAAARAARLSTSIPRRFLGVDFERWPITNLDERIVKEVRRYCRRLDENLEQGRGLYFFGEIGSGKTSLAMVVAKEVLRERRSLAIFSGPDLLARIGATYEERARDTYTGLMDLLGSVDFLVLEDLAVAKQNEWRLEQLYAVINRRYQDQRPLLVTADVQSPELLGEHIGERTCSRIMEMCEPMPFLDGDHRRRGTTPEDVQLAS
ncbi:MAG TPA: ATP-binding protein [Thermoleophilaceae bacterium]|nr:ATP-binding protein [Thermoleophilaceae bacterium]